jgi:hypothetical protein
MRRRVALALLTPAVAVLHLLAADRLAEDLSRLGAGDAASISRIDVAFVQELKPVEPPPAVVLPPPPVLRRAAAAPAMPASAAQGEAGAPPPVEAAAEPASAPAEATASAPDPAASAPSPAEAAPAAPAAVAATPPASPAPPAPTAEATAAAAPAVPPAAPAPSGAVAFEWPPSTRLSYQLVGDYRGPVYGSARVEWLRRGDRYQVHLDVSVSGVVSRRMSSEGLLTAQGLQPQRYEEVTAVLLREPRRLSVRFEPPQVTLANGQVQAAPPGVQDTASQFVQLTWLFTTRPELLQPGRTVEVPLALPRRMDTWVYDVRDEEDVETPVGRVRAFHVKPQRNPPPKGTLSVETWFAPSLQYLPVRIVIRQDDSTFMDLTLSRPPQQEGAPARPR